MEAWKATNYGMKPVKNYFCCLKDILIKKRNNHKKIMNFRQTMEEVDSEAIESTHDLSNEHVILCRHSF